MNCRAATGIMKRYDSENGVLKHDVIYMVSAISEYLPYLKVSLSGSIGHPCIELTNISDPFYDYLLCCLSYMLLQYKY